MGLHNTSFPLDSVNQQNISTILNQLESIRASFETYFLHILSSTPYPSLFPQELQSSEDPQKLWSYNLLYQCLLLRILEINPNFHLSIFSQGEIFDSFSSFHDFLHYVDALFQKYLRNYLSQSSEWQKSSSHSKIFSIPTFDNDAREFEFTFLLQQLRTCLLSYDWFSTELDILGLLYQKQLHISTQKSQGIYYTPAVIRQYLLSIINQHLHAQGNPSPRPLTILDPSCGSGGFLINSYQNFGQSAIFHQNHESIPSKTSSFQIIGMDIDPKALILAHLNLLVRTIGEWSSQNLINQQQSNSKKIKSSSVHFYKYDAISTLDTDFSSPLQEIRGSCDIILGNPPFFEISKFPNFDALYPDFTRVSKPNIASLFLYRYITWLAPGGILAFVFPASILFSNTFLELRRYLVDNFTIIRVVQLGKVFSNVGLEQILLFIQRSPPNPHHQIDIVYNFQSSEDLHAHLENYPSSVLHSQVNQIIWIDDKKARFLLFRTKMLDKMLKRIEANSIPLGMLVDKYSAAQRPTIFRGLGYERFTTERQMDSSDIPILKGNDLIRFGLKSLHFVPTSQIKWHSNKVKAMQKAPKIFLQRLVTSKTRIVATIVPSETLSLSTVENIILSPNFSRFFTVSNHDLSKWLYYIVAVLNSDLMTYYIIDQIFLRCKLSTSLDREYLQEIPLWQVSEADLDSVAALTQEIMDWIEFQPKTATLIEDHPRYHQIYGALNEKIWEIYQISPDEREFICNHIAEFYGIPSRKQGS